MALPTNRPLFHRYLTAYMADVSTASSTFVPVPAAGRLIGIKSALHVAITGADAAITVEVNGTAVTGAALTITQSGSAAGDVDQVTFTGYPVKEGDVIEFISDGASSTTAPMTFMAIIKE